ncbi:NFAT activation molecule 1 [Sinocyclocheilus rhinocerous]|uniref:NFAT activation molecule 1 n=1 Tax=Sinocyclocheilus rhinocerous TaxID=307959 RepID=UPI0007B78C7C|nr:PREDICTED: NFAT activation molecule 1 [Sinocyclocheilus rhinocerous]
MYAAKPVLCWIVILCCWQETLAKPTISMLNRTRVALAGESLDFILSVFIPANYTTSKLVCHHTQNMTRIWNKELKSELFETTQLVRAHINMHNSSSSGNYYFSYANQEVHWVVHVRDKGYQEPPEVLDSAIIIMMAFSGILLIFTVAGSLYILKSYKEHPPCRDDKNEVVEQRSGESDGVILDEDAASASLYTTLQCRSDSIYDTLHSDTMHVENTKKTKSEKHCNAQEDGVFDSVYENL